MMTCLSSLWDHAVEDRKHDDLSVLSAGSVVENRKHDDLSVLSVVSRC